MFQYEDHIKFDDIESTITEGERVGYIRDENNNIIGVDIQDVDELERARILLKEARLYHRFKMDENTPLQEWEK